ncbi:ATP-binding cassette subfamily B protein [Aurantimicrobium minutum]|uniref:ABC transporter ATP-binding protein n=1 Tax=Aurantimicrobium minutum TaxID=708131 RepID=UPI00247694D0|nr:ABC transporter ATP-binding protein [Aurantimicrobium minutum]MDH6531936.1 ATP-binding cassette subfamily B protein [Aurantimicrobium minutum]
MSVTGVRGEERSDFTVNEGKALRQRSLSLLGSLLHPVRVRVYFTLIIVVISTAAQVAGPALLALGIDQGLTQVLDNNNWLPAELIVVAYILTALVSSSMMAIYMRSSALISQTVLLDLRERVFTHTQNLSMSFHENYTSGRIIARQTSDIETLRELLDGGLSSLFRGILLITFTAVALVALDPSSALPLLVALIPCYFLTRWFSDTSKKQFREARTFSARLIVQFVETMTGIRAVKAFRREARNEASYAIGVDDYKEANRKVIRLFGTYDPGLKVIGVFTLASVLLLGSFRVANGAMEVGVLLAAVLYTRRFFEPMEELAMFYNSFQNASSALEKVSGMLEEKPTVLEPEFPTALVHPRGSLDFNNVTFGYNSSSVVLPNLDLHIPAGQTIAMVGTTGAGKSTLAKLVARFYDPVEGSVELDGIELTQIANADLRRTIVMVTQESYLFSGSVADNIGLGKPGATPAEIESAARAVGAHDFIMRLPEGYETDVNKRGGRLSAGQRQLLSFARAFIADPTVLILDEATASLDIPSERLVQHGLQTLLADRTAIIIAHRLSTVAIADRVLVMEHGDIIEDGSPEELIAGTGKFASLHSAWRDSLA